MGRTSNPRGYQPRFLLKGHTWTPIHVPDKFGKVDTSKNSPRQADVLESQATPLCIFLLPGFEFVVMEPLFK